MASKADGHDAADLEALVDRAVHAAVARCIVDSNAPPSGEILKALTSSAWLPVCRSGKGSRDACFWRARQCAKQGMPTANSAGDVTIIQQQDIDTALEGFSSTSSWGLGGGRPSSTITGWQDVGGMESAKSALQEALELPLKYAKLLSRQAMPQEITRHMCTPHLCPSARLSSQ